MNNFQVPQYWRVVRPPVLDNVSYYPNYFMMRVPGSAIVQVLQKQETTVTSNTTDTSVIYKCIGLLIPQHLTVPENETNNSPGTEPVYHYHHMLNRTPIPTGFQPFNRASVEMLTLNSEECNTFIQNHEQDHIEVALKTPYNEYPNFNIHRLRENSTHTVVFHDRLPGNIHRIGRVSILRGTVLNAIQWFGEEKHKKNLFLIIAQVIGVAQKNPALPASKGNEIHILVRDYVEHYPVMRIYLPDYLHSRLPNVQPGYMIQCVGMMMGPLIMEAIRIAVIVR